MARHTLDQDVQQVEEDVAAGSRWIAVRRGVIVGGVGGLLALLVAMGWISDGLSEHVRALIDSGLTAAAAVGAGAWIHRDTTPADQALQPRNKAGQRLVPDTSVSGAVLGADDRSAIRDAVLGPPPPGDTPGAPDELSAGPVPLGGDSPAAPA